MTPEDLISAPDADYMNGAQLSFFKNLLLQQQGEMEEKIRLAQVELSEYENIPDPVDRASQEEERVALFRQRERNASHLKAIKTALARIDNGDYGYCDDTGEPIGIQRLLARPTANLTVLAQEKREKAATRYATELT